MANRGEAATISIGQMAFTIHYIPRAEDEAEPPAAFFLRAMAVFLLASSALSQRRWSRLNGNGASERNEAAPNDFLGTHFFPGGH